MAFIFVGLYLSLLLFLFTNLYFAYVYLQKVYLYIAGKSAMLRKWHAISYVSDYPFVNDTVLYSAILLVKRV